MRDVALEVPLRALALAGRGHSDDATRARVQVGDDALDDAVLAGGVAPLEQHHQALPASDDPLLHVHELGLQAQQLLFVLLVGELLHRLRKLEDVPVRERADAPML